MLKPIILAAALLVSLNAWAEDATQPAKPVKIAKPFVYTAKPTDIVIGKAEAPVTIVEYASLSCPHCADFYNNVMPKLTEKYIDTGKVKLVYRDYPLNEPALKAAAVVQCAEPERRHSFIKVLFSTQDKWGRGGDYKDALASIAALGGVPRDVFDKCFADKALETRILEVEKDAEDNYNVSSTPTFFINGKLHKTDHELESMSKDIDEALAKK